MDDLVKRDSGAPLRHGRRVAVRFLRNNPDVLASLLNLFGTIQISPSRIHPDEMLAHGQWSGPISELDVRLRQMNVAGLALVGLVEEEADEPATVPAVRPWRVAVRFQIKNGPLFVYLTSLLASTRVVPVPYSEQLWVEGTFKGSLDLLKVSLQELKAEEMIVLNRGETLATLPGTMNVQATYPATVVGPPEPTGALTVPASVLERPERRRDPVSARMETLKQPPVAIGLLLVVIILIVGSAGFIAARLEFFNPRQNAAPVTAELKTLPWAHMVRQSDMTSWMALMNRNDWSNEKMTEFLTKLRGLNRDYTRDASLMRRSLELLRSQNIRTPQEFSVFSRLLKVRASSQWPFPDQAPNIPLSGFVADSNQSVIIFYDALAEQPGVLGWLLEHIQRAGRRSDSSFHLAS